MQLAQVRRHCVAAKEALSRDTTTSIPVVLPGLYQSVPLTREQFERMIRGWLEDTIALLQRTLHSAHVPAEQLSAVLLVGASSRIPLVQQMVSPRR